MCVPGCEEAVRQALSRRGFFKRAGVVAAASFAATAVTPEPAEAATFSRVVDLTHTMSPEFPTFFGGPGIEMQYEFLPSASSIVDEVVPGSFKVKLFKLIPDPLK